MKLYKVSMIAALTLLLGTMAWCGVSATITAPVLTLYTLEAQSVDGMLILLPLILGGLISAKWSCRLPSPLPQMIIAALLCAGYVVVSEWLAQHTLEPLLSRLLEAPEEMVLLLLRLWALSLPALSMASAICALPSLFTAPSPYKSRAILSLITLLALIVMADSIIALLEWPTLTWNRIARDLPVLSLNRYAAMLRSAMRIYNSIPVLPRLIVSAVILLVTGRALYVAGLRMLRRDNFGVVRPTPPDARPADDISRTEPLSFGSRINAQDAAMLDALAAQTISGRPIGLDTATGSVSIPSLRR